MEAAVSNNEKLEESKIENKKKCLKNVRNYAKEYCNFTSIHGFKYFGENRSLFEKIWWMIVVISSLICCVTLILQIYKKWEASPVIVTFGTSETPIYEIPFPAITICPETKIDPKLFNFTTIFHKIKNKINMTQEEEKAADYLFLLCDKQFYFNDHEPSKTVTTEFYEFVKNITPDFFKYPQICKWLGYEFVCESFFTPIIIDEGVCYTFNMLDRTEFFTDLVEHYDNFHNINTPSFDWDLTTLKYGYNDIVAYPRRALTPGARASFSIMMITLKDNIDYLCKDSYQGFRVLLHHPANIPRLSSEYFRVPLDQSVYVAVQPVMITTSERLRPYNPNLRGCYFVNERKLKYFQIYTQQNCQLECLANYTKELCDCVAFYMPRENGTKICGPGSFTCTREIESLYLTMEVITKFKNFSFEVLELNKNHSLIKCNCLPPCTLIEYTLEISQTDWDWRKLLQALQFEPKVLNSNLSADKMHISELNIFFKHNHIMGLERHELYGPIDFLANFGGLLSLFTGFSLLSFIEIVYFLTVRIFWNYRLFGRWYGPRNLI